MTTAEKYYPLAFLLMWSSGAIFVKLGLEDASVSVFLTIRSVGAVLALLIACWLTAPHYKLKESLLLPKALLIRVMCVGVLLQVAYQAAYFFALNHHMSPGVLALILGFQPLLTPIFASERIGRAGSLYLLLGLSGLTIALLGARELGSITAIGLCFGLGSVLAITAGAVLQKNTTINPVTAAFYHALIASITFLAVLPFTDIRLSLTPTFVVSALWMSTVVSTLAVVLLFKMLARNSASKVGVLFYMVPVITMAMDYLAFGNKINWLTLLGACLVMVAVKGFGATQAKPDTPTIEKQ